MAVRRIRFTIRAMMVAVPVAAIWLFIISQAIKYQARPSPATARGTIPNEGRSMKCKDLFALGVRLFGVWLITNGIVYVAAFIDGKLYPVTDKARDSAAANLIYATLDFALAAFFLLWTHVIVGWTYGGDSEIAKEEAEARVEDEAGPATDSESGVERRDLVR